MIKNELTENFVYFIKNRNPYHSFTNFSYLINTKNGGIKTEISKFEKTLSMELLLKLHQNNIKKKVKIIRGECLKFLGNMRDLKIVRHIKNFDHCDETHMIKIRYFPESEEETIVKFFTTPLLKLQGNRDMNDNGMKIQNNFVPHTTIINNDHKICYFFDYKDKNFILSENNDESKELFTQKLYQTFKNNTKEIIKFLHPVFEVH